MSRYRRDRIIVNANEFYSFLRKNRYSKKAITQYVTPILKNPGAAARASIVTNTHIWRYGDRFYQLAHTYYGDADYWWVIAWYNGYPTEADIHQGAVLYIPVELEAALNILGV